MTATEQCSECNHHKPYHHHHRICGTNPMTRFCYVTRTAKSKSLPLSSVSSGIKQCHYSRFVSLQHSECVRYEWGGGEATLWPFSDLLCVPIYFIPPVVPYLWRSAVSYRTESHHSRLVAWNVCVSDKICILLKPPTQKDAWGSFCCHTAPPTNGAVNLKRVCITWLLLMAFTIFFSPVDFLWSILVPHKHQ
jgi:hypothetical protein